MRFSLRFITLATAMAVAMIIFAAPNSANAKDKIDFHKWAKEQLDVMNEIVGLAYDNAKADFSDISSGSSSTGSAFSADMDDMKMGFKAVVKEMKKDMGDLAAGAKSTKKAFDRDMEDFSKSDLMKEIRDTDLTEIREGLKAVAYRLKIDLADAKAGTKAVKAAAGADLDDMKMGTAAVSEQAIKDFAQFKEDITAMREAVFEDVEKIKKRVSEDQAIQQMKDPEVVKSGVDEVTKAIKADFSKLDAILNDPAITDLKKPGTVAAGIEEVKRQAKEDMINFYLRTEARRNKAEKIMGDMDKVGGDAFNSFKRDFVAIMNSVQKDFSAR